ncbi:MAG: carbohydrate-binding protein [Bacteroidales bacterium]
MLRLLSVISILVLVHFSTLGQGYLHTSGKKIVNGNGEEVILRGIGTGNWFLQEGYMMKSSDVAGTQWAFMKKLEETIGKERTNTFYKSWLDNHFTRGDVDSLKKWGFNSVRVALHYKWLTRPIENEPVFGQDTWLEEGFIRIDSLLDWCSDNKMYLILDLHGAPGGQGKDANISDYDPSKLSLWESAENRRKTVALWARLAQRYANEPWIGGYDLINEPNWTLPGGTMLKQLYVDITQAIRLVDQNHIIFVEGNWFANDYTGLTPPWDNNMVYSGHKYWTYNNPGDLNYMISIRDLYNVPVWLGETGENSNPWFTSLLTLCENNNVGWSMWPVKKAGINNVLQVPESQKYNNLMSYWKNGTPAITADQAFEAVMEWSANHRIENCMVKHDVIDAMIRQPRTNETKPFGKHKPGDVISAVNYDLGKSSYAYKDTDTADYHLNTNNYVTWNKGWEYRNDGVDIEKCLDNYPGSNGFSVGWTETGEWLQYSIHADSAAGYKLTIRTASANTDPGAIRFLLNGNDITNQLVLPNTGDWTTFNSTTANNIILPAGNNKIRLLFERGGSNINVLSFTNPVALADVPFIYIFSETSVSGNEIFVTLNKDATSVNINPADFQITSNNNNVNVAGVARMQGNNRKLVISLSSPVGFGQVIKISYNGTSVQCGTAGLVNFTGNIVKNNLPGQITVPAKIQAEDYYFNNGFKLEDCTDAGGGKNTAYANNGDYLDYLVNVPKGGEYLFTFRLASIYNNGRISIRISTDGNSFQELGVLAVENTGGWQTWSTQGMRLNLPAGNIKLRLYSQAGEYNINWINIADPTAISDRGYNDNLKVYPNPGKGIFMVEVPSGLGNKAVVTVKSVSGKIVYTSSFPWEKDGPRELDLGQLKPGLYHIQVSSGRVKSNAKVIIL